MGFILQIAAGIVVGSCVMIAVVRWPLQIIRVCAVGVGVAIVLAVLMMFLALGTVNAQKDAQDAALVVDTPYEIDQPLERVEGADDLLAILEIDDPKPVAPFDPQR